jgi:hypothetical protein
MDRDKLAERADEMVSGEGPAVELHCDRCRRRGYPPSGLGVIVWRDESRRWDLFVLDRKRGFPKPVRQAFLTAHGAGPALLRCRRCRWGQSYRAQVLGRLAGDRGVEPGATAVLHLP